MMKNRIHHIGTRKQLARAGNAEIQIGDEMIQPTNFV